MNREFDTDFDAAPPPRSASTPAELLPVDDSPPTVLGPSSVVVAPAVEVRHDVGGEIPSSVAVPLSAIVELGVEQWRLTAWLARLPGAAAAPARRAARKVDDFLRAREVEVRALDGHPFDAGLAATVVHAEDDPGMADGEAVVSETVAPLVLWRGRVVRPAEVFVRRGTRPA